MTATDELCRLLDERGVKWTDHGYKNHIWWKGFDGVRWHAENRHCVDGWRVKVEAIITPEQAITATLGMGVNCSKAEHDAGGCLGFQSGDDDEPVDQCKACHKYTSYEVEL